MPVFYAKAHNILDDRTWRVLLIFASRAVADEWWHAISAGPLPLLSDHIQQISPDLYTHDPTKCNILYFFSDSRFKAVSEKFRGRLFLSLENDRGGRGMSTLPVQSDSVSGPGNSSPGSPPNSETDVPEPVTKPPNSSPPVTSPPVASPPVASPPVASPPVASPPVALPSAALPSAALPFAALPSAALPSATLPPVGSPRQIMAAIIMPDYDGPNPPEIYSKYVVKAKYKPSADHPDMSIAFSVNSDTAVPRFKSTGASNSTVSERSLRVEFQNLDDLTGFATFGGAIGRGNIQFITDKHVNIYGPIEGGPKESQSFVGAGSWIHS